MSLVDIIAAVDSQERLVLSHEELDGGLRRLSEAGRIREVERLRFCAAVGDGTKAFSGLSEEEHDTACRQYRKMFEAILREIESEPEPELDLEPLVICRLTFEGDGGFSDEAQETADDLAEMMAQILPNVAHADVNGFERSSGYINILIYGAGTNAEVDLVYGAVAPLFRAFPARTGSCIIRHYDNRQREVISDLVR
jgi:hypothetical protein